jgi:acetyl esterase/lipase
MGLQQHHASESVLNVMTRLSPKLLPLLPRVVKRLMAGGRAVVIDGNTLDLTLQASLAGQRRLGLLGMTTDDDVALSRRLMRQVCVVLGGPVRPVRIEALSIPGPGGPIPMRHYHPNTAGAAPALVYFHGGGYALGDLDGYEALCARMCADAGIHVFSVDYRLAPEHKAPAAFDDALASFRWVAAHADELGVAAGAVAVGGDSAGGGLAAAVCQASRDGGPAPVLQMLLYPWTDLCAPTRSRTLFGSGLVLTAHDMVWFGEQYLDGSGLGADDLRVSPGRCTDLVGLPPALVVTAGFDPLRDEGNAYAAALARAGVDVDLRQMDGLVHGFANFVELRGAVALAIADVVSALRAHLSPHRPRITNGGSRVDGGSGAGTL